MYQFVDVIEHEHVFQLPTEALAIDGSYIEHMMSDYMTSIEKRAEYRTLTVSGRELLAPELKTTEVGMRDGVIYNGRHLPSREIKVKYQIIAEDAEAYRAAYNKLNAIFREVEQAQLIFADEPDKYFVGSFHDSDNVEEGHNAVIGEFTLLCSDPCKYSVEEYEAELQGDESGQFFAIDYNGTMPSYPKLFATFYHSDEADNSDGDCGFVSFFNDDGNILQFGNADEEDLFEQRAEEIIQKQTTTQKVADTSKQLFSETFNSNSWAVNSGTTRKSDHKQVGTVKCGKLTSGATNNAVMPSGFGSGASWHGPSITKTIGSDGGNPAATGAIDWEIKWTQRFAQSKNAQTGCFQAWLCNSDGTKIIGIDMWKNADTSKGTIAIRNGKTDTVKQWNDISFAKDATRFGYGKNASCAISIVKKGSSFTVKIANLSYTFSQSAYDTKPVHKVTFYFGKYKTKEALYVNGVYGCTFKSNSVKKTTTSTEIVDQKTEIVQWLDETNTFTTNDVLEVETASATCSLGDIKDDEFVGVARPDLGALGNEWEEFCLMPGMNQIGFSYSDWVDSQYAPTPSVKYREVFL